MADINVHFIKNGEGFRNSLYKKGLHWTRKRYKIYKRNNQQIYEQYLKRIITKFKVSKIRARTFVMDSMINFVYWCNFYWSLRRRLRRTQYKYIKCSFAQQSFPISNHQLSKTKYLVYGIINRDPIQICQRKRLSIVSNVHDDKIQWWCIQVLNIFQ